MVEAKSKTEEMDLKADELNARYGKTVRAFIPATEETFFFRRPTRAEITHFNKQSRTQPDMNVEHSIGLCRSCFVGPGDIENRKGLETAFNEYSLAFAGTSTFEGVADHLIKLATGEAAITVK